MTTTVEAGASMTNMAGDCDPRFERVREEFERNFAERGEVGASVCVTLDGETVVDLWGGLADPTSGRPWKRDTICTVFSCTKGAVALCAHMLADRGLLDFDAPVAQYWPEFTQNGKEAITVRMLLNHQSGVVAHRDPVPPGGLLDWDLACSMLAAQDPFWNPGTTHGYHAMTFGFLVGEVIRRITGKMPGVFFRDEVAGPLGIDFYIGLPESEEPRVAPIIPHDLPADGSPLPLALLTAMQDQSSIQFLCYFNNGGFLQPEATNSRAVRAAEVPSANGVANARALAGMYRPLALGGEFDGVRLVSSEGIPAMSAVSSAAQVDAFALTPTRFALGFVKTIDNRHQRPGDQESALLSEDAFGHIGFGGSIGFADPRARLSFGYAMNKQRAFQVLDDRAQSLINAVYEALGYRLSASGAWFKFPASSPAYG